MLNILEHTLITHKLTQLRKKNTSTKDFRQILEELAGLMAYEISKNLPLKEIKIETPISKCSTKELSADIVLIPILRAGLGMVNGITSLIPNARVGHMGLFRNENTLEPERYYSKFPTDLQESVVMILDPMLATGGTASATLDELKRRGAKNLKLVCIVGSPQGVEMVEKQHPDVEIILAALDEKLDEKGYIIPGLGDAGDRIFGTR